MSILDPLRQPFYEYGQLVQQCAQCDWAQRGHVVELVVCPDCGALLTTPLALQFGGLWVIHDGKNFLLRDGQRNPADRICRGDVTAVVQFLCKHGEDDRRGVAPREHVERIAPVFGQRSR